jgi:FkbM family methyltransferase
MTNFRTIAQTIRHLPGLKNAEGLWSLLRRPYHRLLNIHGKGVEIMVGGVAAIRIPAEYAGGSWEDFEPETVVAFIDWLKNHPGGLVLDLGCSIGIYSAVALFADTNAQVVAFDSDLSSLVAVRRMTTYATGERLQLIYGFLADHGEVGSLVSVVTATNVALAQASVRGDVGTTRYMCLVDKQTQTIPRRRLDDLFAEGFDRPCLIKCDVEGAEQVVLSGGEQLLRRFQPELLLSVHPSALPQYGHSVNTLRSFLETFGYEMRCLAIDHEEHWLCRRSGIFASPKSATARYKSGH